MGRTPIRRKIDLEGFLANQIYSEEVNLIKMYRQAPTDIQNAVKVILSNYDNFK